MLVRLDEAIPVRQSAGVGVSGMRRVCTVLVCRLTERCRTGENLGQLWKLGLGSQTSTAVA